MFRLTIAGATPSSGGASRWGHKKKELTDRHRPRMAFHETLQLDATTDKTQVKVRRLRLPGRLEQVAEARRFVAAAAADAGMAPDRVFDVQVAVSEACANAIEHAQTDVREIDLEVFIHPDRLVILVRSPGVFVLAGEPPLDRDKHRGFGLPIMAMLADRLSIRRQPEGMLLALTFHLGAGVVPEPHLAYDPHQAISDGFLAVDRSWRILFANEAAATLLGAATAKDINGLDVRTLLRTKWPAEAEHLFSRGLERGERTSFDLFVPTLDTWIESRLFPIPDGVSIYLRDVGERKRIELELRASESLWRALSDINMQLASTGQWETLFRRALVEAAAVLNSDHAAIVLKSERGWKVKFMHGLTNRLGESLTEKSPELIGRLLARDQFICRPNTEIDGNGDAVTGRAESHSFIAASIRSWGEMVGYICFEYLSQAQPALSSVSFVRDLGNSLSFAFEHARILEEKTYIAGQLQQALLVRPSTAEGLIFGHAYRSASDRSDVGGDFYDVFRIRDDSVGLMIGDVCGHGLEAAMLASLVKETIRTFAFEGEPVDVVLAKTNRALVRRKVTSFTTVFYALLHPSKGKLTYCSAGHPPALLRREDANVEQLKIGHFPLGVVDDARYKSEEVIVCPGDLLLLYSDGIIEARRSGELFGEERLMRLLAERSGSPQALVEIIMKEGETFSGGRFLDDVALLAMIPRKATEQDGGSGGK